MQRSVEQYQEFREFRSKSISKVVKPEGPKTEVTPEQTPLEAIEDTYETIRGGLVGELIDQIMRCSPGFFERLVVDLLVRMGYGGTRKDAGQAVGKSGDEGIDGIINEDRLGLEVVYIQARSYRGAWQ